MPRTDRTRTDRTRTDRTGRASSRVRLLASISVACVLAGALVACGGSEDQQLGLPDLLIGSDQLPKGFTAAPMVLGDLIKANKSTLDQAKSVQFTPPECAPTADAEFNPALTEDNAALLVGQSDDGTFSELVSTVRRNVDADRRASTGPCAVVTAVPSQGSQAGARIVTTSTEIPAPKAEALQQSFVVRSETVRTFPGGDQRSEVRMMANLLVKDGSDQVVTVQLGVSAADRAVAPGQPGPGAPMSDDDFIALVRTAVARASR